MRPLVVLSLGLAALAVTPDLARAGEPRQYKILVREATVRTTKQLPTKQEAWDGPGGGKPDPYVVVELDGRPVFVSGKDEDTLRPRWFTGTEYWPVARSTRVRIVVRDADAGNVAARVGLAGVAVHPDLPEVGKELLADALLKVDSDDTVAVWSGTLEQLIADCGGSNRDGDLLGTPQGKAHFTANAGLESLTVRVIDRPAGFNLERPPAGSAGYLGLRSARVERFRRSSKKEWDAGAGAAQNPDPRYLVYVNGTPALADEQNGDTFEAHWARDLPPLHLFPDDQIAIAVADADVGTFLAQKGRYGLLFSQSLSIEAKAQLFKELGKASTDDPIFLWVGTWESLKAKGDRFELPTAATGPGVWRNDGLSSVTVVTAPDRQGRPGPVMTLTVNAVRVAARKADGSRWDPLNGEPDPFVKCFVAAADGGWDEVGKTKAVKDAFTGAWNLRLSDKRLLAGRRLKCEVYDDDGASNDLVGTVAITIPDAAGTHKLKDDQIEELELRFDRR